MLGRWVPLGARSSSRVGNADNSSGMDASWLGGGAGTGVTSEMAGVFGGCAVTLEDGGGGKWTVLLPDATGASCGIHASKLANVTTSLALTRVPGRAGTFVPSILGEIVDWTLGTSS